MPITLPAFVSLFEARLHECLNERRFDHEEQLRVCVVGTLLELGVRLQYIWPEYPLAYEMGRRIDLIVDTFDRSVSLAFELKYLRSKMGKYQPGTAAASIAEDIMRLGAVSAHQKRQCIFVLLLDDEAQRILCKSAQSTSQLLELPKGATMPFEATTLMPSEQVSYLKSLHGMWNPCRVTCLSSIQVGSDHHLLQYRVVHTPDSIYDWAG
jgi:hypothetical protein